MAAFVKDEETNWNRACRLLTEAGTELLILYLKDTLQRAGCVSLDNLLAANRRKLDNVAAKGILQDRQMDILYPASGFTDTNLWDITLASCVMTYCIPDKTRLEKGAISTIRDLRNRLHHDGKMKMHDDKYTKNWADIQQCLSVAARDLGVSQHFSLHAWVDRIEKEQIIDGEELRNTLQAWKTSDNALHDAIEQIGAEQRSCHTDIQIVLSEVRGIKTIMTEDNSRSVKRTKFDDSGRGEHNTMEVSATGACKRSGDRPGSDVATKPLQCELCSDNRRFEVASAFCINCSDYLCTDCDRRHRKIRVFKDHTLMEGAAMPKEKPRDGDGSECLEHRGKLLKLYCHSDDMCVCVRCITKRHRKCTDVTLISKLSTGLEKSQELRDVKKTSRKQKKLLGTCRDVINEYRVLNVDCYDKTIEEFETFKNKIEAGLDLLGKRVYIEARELKERNEKKLDSLSESLKSLRQELDSLMLDIETKDTTRKMDQLFIALKKNTKDIVENRNTIDGVKKDLHIHTYTFVADPQILHTLDKMVSTKPIKVFSGDVKCTSEINVKASKDKEDCLIAGLVEISPTDILALDGNNNCLKRIDVNKKVIITRRTLSSRPFDVTVIPGSRVAVTLPVKCQIQYFDTQKQLAPCGSIQVDAECCGIQSLEDTLIVSFGYAGKVEIMDFKGHVKRSITTASGGSLMYLGLSPDQTNIYVSDNHNGVVTCLSTDGQVNWKYKGTLMIPDKWEDSMDEGEGEDEKQSEDGKEHENGGEEDQDSEDELDNDHEGFSPKGLSTGTDGCLYISSCQTNSIHVVSPAGIRLEVIPVTQYRIRYPGSLYFSKMQESLYVSSISDDPDYDNFIRRLSFQSMVKQN